MRHRLTRTFSVNKADKSPNDRFLWWETYSSDDDKESQSQRHFSDKNFSRNLSDSEAFSFCNLKLKRDVGWFHSEVQWLFLKQTRTQEWGNSPSVSWPERASGERGERGERGKEEGWTLPLQPLPLEEPVVVHAVEVVSERRHAQEVVDQSGTNTKNRFSRKNEEKWALVLQIFLNTVSCLSSSKMP